jgi:mediator of RNA polymerase II transcription subunit 16
MIFSIQSSLGYTSHSTPRTFEATFAFILLQMRQIVVLLVMAASYKIPRQDGGDSSPLDYADVIFSLAGSVSWSLQLITNLTSSLSSLPRSASVEQVAAHLRNRNDPTLYLLMSSTPRAFLIALTKRLAHISFAAHKAPSSPVPIAPQLRAAYQKIARLTDNCLIPLDKFSVLLQNLSTAVKDTYEAASMKLGNEERTKAELALLTGKEVPELFNPVVEKLIGEGGFLEACLKDVDRGELFFAPAEGMGLVGAKLLEKWGREGRVQDAFSRGWLFKGSANGGDGKRWRRCVRCCTVMADVPPASREMQWLVMQLRKCWCGEYWNLLGKGKWVA